MTKNDFSKGIKRKRKQENLKVSDISNLTNIDSPFITKVENGETFFSFENAITILNALNMDFDDCLLDNELSFRIHIINKIKEITIQNLNTYEIKFFTDLIKKLNVYRRSKNG